jgi:hypothetical protein
VDALVHEMTRFHHLYPVVRMYHRNEPFEGRGLLLGINTHHSEKIIIPAKPAAWAQFPRCKVRRLERKVYSLSLTLKSFDRLVEQTDNEHDKSANCREARYRDTIPNIGIWISLRSLVKICAEYRAGCPSHYSHLPAAEKGAEQYDRKKREEGRKPVKNASSQNCSGDKSKADKQAIMPVPAKCRQAFVDPHGRQLPFEQFCLQQMGVTQPPDDDP